MHQRAVLTLHSSPSLNLSAILYNAASSAWTRRTSHISKIHTFRASFTLPSPPSSSSPEASQSPASCSTFVLSPSKLHIPPAHFSRRSHPKNNSSTKTRRNVEPSQLTDPDATYVYRTVLADDIPSRRSGVDCDSHENDEQNSMRYWEDSTVPKTLIPPRPQFRQPSLPPLPIPQTRNSLYRNLLRIISPTAIAIPSFPALVDYHDLYPKLRNARSYNLLIREGLRHHMFGTVDWLFKAMHADNIPRTRVTHRLYVRFLVSTGRWEDAWNLINSTSSAQLQDMMHPAWLELLSTPKRGTIHVVDGPLELDHADSPKETTTNDVMFDSHLSRLRPVLQTSYSRSDPLLLKTRAVSMWIKLLLKSGRVAGAVSLAIRHASELPTVISPQIMSDCLQYIHAIVSFGTSRVKKGLSPFQHSRKTLIDLTELHPALTPNAKTLFLLLAHLKGAKRCGTMAFATLEDFTKRWGNRFEDSRVRRRVASLALKEGRTDIVDQLLNREMQLMGKRRASQLERQVVGEKVILEYSNRKPLVAGKGREARLWALLRARRSRRKLKQAVT